jgi:pimeloyl-ACP methyl ester carboxylesterase
MLLSTPSTTPTAIDKVIKWSWSPDTDPKLLNKVREQMLETRSAVIYGDYLACNNFDLTSRLHEIEVPALIIAGDRDKMTPLYLNEQLKKGMKQADLAVIPDGGHMVMLEQPQAVAGKIYDFVQSLPH